MKSKKITSRLATAKDVEFIWDFYLKTNFLYEEKLSSMGDFGASARETLRRCLKLNSDDFRICMSFDEERRLRSLCTHALFSDAQAWVMHLASDGDVKAMASSILACKPLTARSTANWIAYTFRGNNRSVRKLFTSVNNRLECDTENELYHFFKIGTLDLAGNGKKVMGGAIVRRATQRDRLTMIEKTSDCSELVALYALGDLDDFPDNEIQRRFEKAGLPFERKAWAVKFNGETIGLAIGEIRPPWWNMSNLSTGVRLFLTLPEPEIARHLLTAAAEWFDEREVKNWSMLVPPHDSATLAALNDCAVVTTKPYYRMTVPAAAAAIYDHYGLFVDRAKNRTTPITAETVSI